MSSYTDKLRERFATFDHDHDGYVTEGDFMAMAGFIIVDFGLASSDDKARALQDAARHYFHGLAAIADSDGDGRITEQEFLHAAEEKLHGNPRGFERVIRPWANAVSDVADTDGDGRVNVVEWWRMLRAMGASSDGARIAAGAVDTDGDGFVSVDEVIAAARLFYTSDRRMPEFAASH